MTDHKDPWADLAESLGAEPAQESLQQPARPTPPPSKPAAAARLAPPKPAVKADWNDVADSLGLPAARPAPASPSPAVPPAEPVGSRSPEQTRATSGFGAGLLDEPATAEGPSRPPRATSSSSRPPASQPAAGEEPVTDFEGRPAAESDTEGDEPRRRRRRRGGRGRGRREDRREGGEPTSRSQEKECLPGYGHNLDEERQERGSDRPSTGGLKADIRPHAPWEDEFGRGLDEDAEDLLDEAATTDRSVDRGSRTAQAEGDTDGEERTRRRRRRRRGRRNRDEAESGSPGDSTTRRRDTDGGQAAEAAEASDASGEGEAAAGEPVDEPTRRRRRRRRRRSSESADGAGEAPAERPRRTSDESPGSRQRSSRGGRRRETGRSGDSDGRRRRRETFSRVCEGRDEDDEGLEFLGMEGSLAEPGDRRPTGDEELLAESGLDSVRDVPSWVEAIGIVIAGNMDSRKQPPKG